MNDSTQSESRRRETIRSPYSALSGDHIRLLRICRSSIGASFDFDIETQVYALEAETQYTALSYCWGAASDDRLITLDGDIDCPLKIRLNLWHFLNAITKKPDTPNELFWIDAVSIDQTNLRERSEQVQLMPQIYSGAHRVLVWLGAAEHSSDRAMRCLQRAQALDIPKTLDLLWTTATGAAFANLCQRPYWSRLWVVQELILGQRLELMCGQYEVPWHTMSAVYQHMTEDISENLFKSRSSYMRTLNSPGFAMARRLAHKRQPSSLMSLVFQTSDLKCAERLDKVFALLGLSDSAIRVDYSVPIVSLLNAVLREHYTIYPAENLEGISTSCRKLSRCLTQKEDTIFELTAMRSINGPLEKTLCIQCMCTHHYLRKGLVPRHIMPSVCWAQTFEHHEITSLLFSLDDCKPDELVMRVLESGCQSALRLLSDSGAFASSNMLSSTQRRIGWAQNVNMASFIDFISRDPEPDLNADIPTHARSKKASASPREPAVRRVDLVNCVISQPRADVNAKDASGSTALMHAVKRGDESIVAELLGHRAIGVNANDLRGRTALMYAILRERERLVHLLLQHRATDINASDNTGRTAFVYAIIKDRPKPIDALLQHDLIDLETRDNLGMTPLMYAIDQHNVGLIDRMLAVQGLEINNRDNDQCTPLMHAVQSGGHLIVAKLLTVANIGIATTPSNPSLLDYAVQCGDAKTVQTILNIKRGRDRVRELLDLGPRMAAVPAGNIKMTEVLRNEFAREIDSLVSRLMATRTSGVTANHCEQKYLWPLILNKWYIYCRLTDKESKLVCSTVRWRVRNALRHLLKISQQLEVSALELGSDDMGRTPLHYAAMVSDADGVREILSHGPEHLNLIDSRGRTALFHALVGGDGSTVRALLGSEAVQVDKITAESLQNLLAEQCAMFGDYFEPRRVLTQMKGFHWGLIRKRLEAAGYHPADNYESRDESRGLWGSPIAWHPEIEGRGL